jgi:hypothetical protein
MREENATHDGGRTLALVRAACEALAAHDSLDAADGRRG